MDHDHHSRLASWGSAALAGLALTIVVAPGTRGLPRPPDLLTPLVWAERAGPGAVAVAAGRCAAAVVLAWFAAGLVAAGAARVLRAPDLARWAPAVTRRLAGATLALGVVPAITPLAPLGPVRDGHQSAATPVARPVAPLAPDRGPAPTPGPTPTPAPTPAPAAAPAGDPAPPTPPEPGGPGAGPEVHRVAPGEHLWSIARAVLVARGGEPDPAALDDYWRALCAANRDRIRSGDVNRLEPGEELVLP